jgi:hypothetical protein
MITVQSLNDQFVSLINGGQFVAGSNQTIRAEFWEAFKVKYPEQVAISVNGVQVTLQAHWSLSRKSCSYSAIITKADYMSILGYDFGMAHKKEPFVTLQSGIVTVHGGGNYFTKVPNKFCNII